MRQFETGCCPDPVLTRSQWLSKHFLSGLLVVSESVPNCWQPELFPNTTAWGINYFQWDSWAHNFSLTALSPLFETAQYPEISPALSSVSSPFKISKQTGNCLKSTLPHSLPSSPVQMRPFTIGTDKCQTSKNMYIWGGERSRLEDTDSEILLSWPLNLHSRGSISKLRQSNPCCTGISWLSPAPIFTIHWAPLYNKPAQARKSSKIS